jgi:hypothetical protein
MCHRQIQKRPKKTKGKKKGGGGGAGGGIKYLSLIFLTLFGCISAEAEGRKALPKLEN